MKKWFWAKALATLIAVGLLVAGVWSAYRVGWWQGYQVGQVAERGEEGTTPHAGPFGYHPGLYRPYWGFHPFGFVRPLLTLALFLLLFALIVKVFRFWAWRKAWGAAGENGHRYWFHGHPPRGHWPHGHPPHGPVPPWCWGEEKPADKEPFEEQVGKVRPDVDAAESES